MADSDVKQQPETCAPKVQAQENSDDNGEKKLKYLEFVQVAAIYIVVCFSTVYEYAKENSGPLKPGVQTVKGTVKTVIGPVYEKFHDVPIQLLKFVDGKVLDDALNEVEEHVPLLVKQASNQAVAVVQRVAAEVRSSGVVDATKNATRALYATYEPGAKELINKYEPAAQQYAVAAWRWLNPQVAQIAVPTVAYWAERYNQVVSYAVERGYAVGSYLPLIPVEKIAKVFEEGESGPTVTPNGDAHVEVH